MIPVPLVIAFILSAMGIAIAVALLVATGRAGATSGRRQEELWRGAAAPEANGTASDPDD